MYQQQYVQFDIFLCVNVLQGNPYTVACRYRTTVSSSRENITGCYSHINGFGQNEYGSIFPKLCEECRESVLMGKCE